MRLVITGTKEKLYRLRAEDLPDDRDLRGSFWKRVDASGFDLSSYNCESMDIHDSVCRAVILPDSVDFTVSLRSDWTDAKIPVSLPFCGWSLIGEVLNRHTAPARSREAEAIAYVQGLVANAHIDARDPWAMSRYHFETQLGMKGPQIYEAFKRYVFGGYPNLLSALHRYCDGALVEPTPAGQALRVTHPETKEIIDVPDDQLRPFNTEDRWSAERMLEQYLGPGWRVKVFFLVPRVWVTGAHEKDHLLKGEWWRGVFPG